MKSVIRGCFFSLLLASSVGVNAESVAIADSSQVSNDNDSDGVKIVQEDSLNRLVKRRSLEFTSPQKNFKFVPYGFIRNDFYYDSRQNFETASGLFYIIPKDVNENPEGEDLNGVPSSGFLSIASRLGVRVYGPQVFKAQSYAQLESGGLLDSRYSCVGCHCL